MSLTCKCTSPCTKSITCPNTCICECKIDYYPDGTQKCVSESCSCGTFALADLEEKGKSLNLRLDSVHHFDMKQMPMQYLARYFAYHAPSLDLLMPVEMIERVIDFQATEPEPFSSIIKKLGFRVVSNEQSS